VRFLLDENFPLAFHQRLLAEQQTSEHIIILGLRGASDAQIRVRLTDPDLIFFTHDDDFLFGPLTPATVVLSRVSQSRPLRERVAIWLKAARALGSDTAGARLELLDDGSLVRWEAGPNSTWIAGLPRRSTSDAEGDE
jgi:hypothetical protein